MFIDRNLRSIMRGSEGWNQTLGICLGLFVELRI